MLDRPVSRASRALRRVAIAGAIALASQMAAAADGPAGHYRINDGPDVASELILRPDGRFEYFLAAGSLDEQAQGTWQVEGGTVRLRTIPKPVPATFAAGSVKAAPGAPLVLHVTNPAGQGISSVHFTIGFDSGPTVKGYTQDYGWSLDGDEKRAPRWIEFSVPIYGLQSGRFPLDLREGNELTFILTPNDIGTIDFTGVQIDIQPNRLVMHRSGALITYEARPRGQ
jgi:hypothetical protein